MSREYRIRQHNRKNYSAVSIHFLIKDLEHITAQAVKYGVSRHALLSRAIKLGMPQVLANLDRIANASSVSQAAKEGGQQHGS